MTTSVLVTGASSGIGAATAVELAGRGHQVFAAARRTDHLAALAERDPRIVPISMDVTDHDSVGAAVDAVHDRLGRSGVDVLVNNAGFAVGGPVETTSDDEVRRQFDTNVFGLLTVTRAVLPGMRARGSGRIVTMSSVLGRTTLPASGVYSASKHAVEALSDALRAELSAFGIDVVVVEPGFVRTELGDHLTAADDGPYAGLAAAAERFVRTQIAGGADPAELARLLARVVEARRPRTRYLFPPSSRFVVGMSALVPDRLADRALLRVVGTR